MHCYLVWSILWKRIYKFEQINDYVLNWHGAILGQGDISLYTDKFPEVINRLMYQKALKIFFS